MRRRQWFVLFASVLLVALLGAPATAHEERPSQFPPIDSPRRAPEYRPHDEAVPTVVVCKPDSAERVAAMADPDVRARNQHLLDVHGCDFQHLQAAVDWIEAHGEAGTNVYLLPGVYREEPSVDASCIDDYADHTGAYLYTDVIACGEVINLVTIVGDDPDDPDMACDNNLCDLQVEGTGEQPTDVLFRGGFTADGDWVKHNGIKVDRGDGIYLKNMAGELFRENAFYVHETVGYRLDGVVARHNDLYGILTFTSDRGIIENCDAHHNGDSGIYPGSAAEVNGDNPDTGPLERYAVEIRNCISHHNALGYSGTAGNSVWIHDNEFVDNGAGIVTDSFVGGHPGMPQDHLWIADNRIHRNNTNFYREFVHSGVCARPPGERGYESGTVCPAFPVPVGTGIMIAGGNNNFVDANAIYDNWRIGAMLFYVPSVLRSCLMGFDPGDPFRVCDGGHVDEGVEPLTEDEVSNDNHFTNNVLGRHPAGVTQPNGLDFWWDDQGIGNCWQDNTPANGEVTHNATLLLPDCTLGSASPVPNPDKSAGLLYCAQYNRNSNPDPDGCDWFDDPAMPAGRELAPGESAPAPAPTAAPTPAPDDTGTLPATGGGLVLAALGTGMLALSARMRRGRSTPPDASAG